MKTKTVSLPIAVGLLAFSITAKAQYDDSTLRRSAQPATNVEAAPLEDSRASNLRKAREHAEVSTEQRIVEKLEESRLQDEKKRADRLFGNRLEEPEVVVKKEVIKEEIKAPAPLPPPPPVVPAPLPPQVIVVQPTEFVPPKAEPKEVKREEREEDEDFGRWYVGALLGTSSYSGVSNVQGNFAGGFSIGQLYKNGLILEGTFLFSNYYLNDYYTAPAYQNVDQYGFSMAAKYQMLRNHRWFHPFIGGVAQYTKRDYTSKIGGSSLDSSTSSNAFDLGVSFGVDATLTEEMSVGIDARYMANVFAISNSTFIDGNNAYYGYGAVKPLEKAGYWTVLLTGKYHF